MSGKPKPVKVDGGGDGGDKEESKPKPKMEVDDEKMWILDSAKFMLCHSETDENNHTVFYFEEVQKWEDVDKKDDFMYKTRYCGRLSCQPVECLRSDTSRRKFSMKKC